MTDTTTKTRKQRTPEQMIADLQAEIDRVKKKAAAKAAKSTDEGKLFIAAVRATDKAIGAAEDAEDGAMQHALETARAAMGEHLVSMGLRAPVARTRAKRGASGGASGE